MANNFKYRRMYLNPNPKNVVSAELNASHIDQQLTQESNLNKSAAWNKLGKTNKMKILNEYVDRCCAVEHGLSASEAAALKQYFSQSLDDKMLQHVKDVVYDKTTGQLVGIPPLLFNPVTRKFTLKRLDKKLDAGGTVKKRSNPVKSHNAASTLMHLPVKVLDDDQAVIQAEVNEEEKESEDVEMAH